MVFDGDLPSGELTFCHEKIRPFLIGKNHLFLWAIFHCYVSSPEGKKFKTLKNSYLDVHQATTAGFFHRSRYVSAMGQTQTSAT